MAAGYGETVVLRTSTMRSVGLCTVVVAMAGVAVSVPDGTASAHWGAPLLLVALVGWAAFWNPRVEVSDGGVLMVNVLRSVEIPWPAVEGVDGRYGLQLRTAYGAFTAWGAGAPTGRDRARSRESAAAVLVRERLDALQAAGWLEDPRLERPSARVSWHRPVIAVVAVLLVVSVALPLLR
jgi:hypothetical protein